MLNFSPSSMKVESLVASYTSLFFSIRNLWLMFVYQFSLPPLECLIYDNIFFFWLTTFLYQPTSFWTLLNRLLQHSICCRWVAINSPMYAWMWGRLLTLCLPTLLSFSPQKRVLHAGKSVVQVHLLETKATCCAKKFKVQSKDRLTKPVFFLAWNKEKLKWKREKGKIKTFFCSNSACCCTNAKER